jgi:glutamate N-acetyltransferase/amino-acid N-acetyltransferase
MDSSSQTTAQGTITSPKGFQAGAIYAGIKTAESGVRDLGLLRSEVPCTAAAVFTTNAVKAAPVHISQRVLESRSAQGLIVNSGCANACTGQQGIDDATSMVALAAERMGLSPQDVFVASTGVIGKRVPMDLVKAGIPRIDVSSQGGHELADAILTTDTFPKERAVSVQVGADSITIGGIAKGAGMIHPNMATMLAFITTDAAVEAGLLQAALRRAVDNSFNMITIDGDTSTNDTVLLLANGMASSGAIGEGTREAEEFESALNVVCLYLAKEIARDGEGATRLIEVNVQGATTLDDARRAARTIASSALVKTAIHGCDPNWGRIMGALGRSGAEIVESQVDITIGDISLVRSGCATDFEEKAAKAKLMSSVVSLGVCLNLGEASATAWGCDLSHDYVTLNSTYTT